MSSAVFTLLRRISVAGGDVFHGLKASEPSYSGFGEAYFTTVDRGVVKGWKRHNRMVLNLVVPAGCVQVSVFDDHSSALEIFRLGPELPQTYGRLTVPPGLWVAFGGVGLGLNLMLNIASIEHDPSESDSRAIDAFPWKWGTP
jgi:dTDP-4-dehydrorhamnose 3,5-epimerase